MNKIILASQSPRRRELLAAMGVVFDIVPSAFDERLDNDRSPEEVAVELALGKAREVAEQHPYCYVVGSDTIVTVDGKQLGKPASAKEAHEMLRMLSGKAHTVSTGVAVIHRAEGIEHTGVDTAYVFFRPYDEAAVHAYVASGDSFDKAGGYGIQSGAATLIDHIEGHYDTVVGLPTHLLSELLARVNLTARPVELESSVPQVKI